jgi:hypothetical protein
MWKIGWETHYIAASRSASIPQDTLKLLAKKQLRDIRWLLPGGSFLPVDIALWAYLLWIATERAVNRLFARH